MKPSRFLSFLFLICTTAIQTACGPWISGPLPWVTITPMPTVHLVKTSTYDLQPTVTARLSPTGNYCDDATLAGARTKLTFQEIIPCLDTIEKVSQFMQNILNTVTNCGFKLELCDSLIRLTDDHPTSTHARDFERDPLSSL